MEDKLLDPTTAAKCLAIVGGVIVTKVAGEVEVFQIHFVFGTKAK